MDREDGIVRRRMDLSIEDATDLVENCVGVTEVVVPRMLSEECLAEMGLDQLDGYRILVVHQM